MTTLRAFLLMVASMGLALGLTLPLVRFERLWLFDEAPSLLGIVGSLWSDGEAGLAALVALVSIVFPVLKLATVHRVALEPSSEAPRWLSVLSKWSMTDVLLVAIAILAAKTSGLAAAASEPGIWFYGGSAVAAYVASAIRTAPPAAPAAAAQAERPPAH